MNQPERAESNRPITVPSSRTNVQCGSSFFNIGPVWNEKSGEILKACETAGRVEKILYSLLDIIDVTNHAELYRVMNHECQRIRESYDAELTRYWVATASGTPAMQTVWVLLVESGLFPATLLVTSPPQFTHPGVSPVREVNFNLDDFPQIQSPDDANRQLSVLQSQIEFLTAHNAALHSQNKIPLELPEEGIDLRYTMRQTEIAFYRLALLRSGGNAAEAARLLKISPHAFRKRSKDLGLKERMSFGE